ncbi:hypothetical protein [Cerasicoccus arenae]|uniref:Secretin/TonB short N-terminal domain-containing protein n=1 Tax=Cerasicoccus arenae TaxID=424488 RepID=A0A8J3GEI4_9BACT|nr:hypothetical protein [Cerasicoccus arenae]MBK1859666.1 hypothetical protein [Cerasicoccus arenae]GHC03932.1 hypothetical protein GCM10007047_20680 [Cerasicoccus arenae]
MRWLWLQVGLFCSFSLLTLRAQDKTDDLDLVPLIGFSNTDEAFDGFIVFGRPTDDDEETQPQNVDFHDEEIRKILRETSNNYDLNLFIHPLLEGRTSFQLYHPTWEEIFETALAGTRFTYRKDENLIFIEAGFDDGSNRWFRPNSVQMINEGLALVVDSFGVPKSNIFDLEIPLVLALHYMPSYDTISVDFPNEAVGSVLRNCADLYALEVQIPPALSKIRTSIKLRNVCWQEVFRIALEPKGYTFWFDDHQVYVIHNLSSNHRPSFGKLEDYSISIDNF